MEGNEDSPQTKTEVVDMMLVPHLEPANPFAFSLDQMSAIVDQKHIEFIEKMNGIENIAKGLHTDLKSGLNHEEGCLPYIRMLELQNSTKQEASLDSQTLPDSHTLEPFSQRKNIFGINKLPPVEKVTLVEIMWQSFQDKTLIMLTISAMISLILGIYEDVYTIEYDALGNKMPGVKWIEGVAIIVAVVLVVIVTSVNDYQKERKFQTLNSKKDDRMVLAIRSGQKTAVSVHDVQVGDILALEPGDIICADGIFIEGHNLKCDESSATGESDAVAKDEWRHYYQEIQKCKSSSSTLDGFENEFDLHLCKRGSFESDLGEGCPNPFLLSGSKVIEGICTYIVTAVGENSFYGRTLMALRTKDENTPLQDKLDVLATSIAKFGLLTAGSLLFMLIIRSSVEYYKGSLSTVPSDIVSHITQILITTVTVVVIAVPEGLPLAVTLALAYATQRMLKDNNLVRVLASCETMGNATTICSDKTGTLTQNKMEVVAGTFGSSFRFLRNPPTSRTDLIDIDNVKDELPNSIRNFINQAFAVNSNVFQNAGAANAIVGNKTETAMWNFAREYLKSEPFETLRNIWPIVTVYPFSSSRKAMATVIRIPCPESDGYIYRMHIKGASERLLDMCTHIVSIHDPLYSQSYRHDSSNYDVAVRLMTDDNHERMLKVIQSYATRCLRTLAFCYRDFETWPTHAELDNIMETGQLTLLGIIGIEDPLRPGVTNAVATCQQAGVCVRMVTGDNMLTAKSIARQCGIYSYGTLALDGVTFRNMTREQRLRVLPKLRVLARSNPEDKRLLVQTLRDTGEIVAVTGDGTNDGPALKAADVGFSMGISGTEVAKEASSIILMDDNFESIIKAISWGRCVNDSVKKFLQFQLTINVTAVILTIVSSVVSDKQASILSTVQLLWINLLMDTFAALALATDSPSPDLLRRKPEQRTAPLINKCMWRMVLGQSLYQLVVILIMLYTDILGLSNNKAALQTMIFTTYVFCQIFNEINCRRIDNQINVFRGIKANKFFICLGQVLIVQYGGAAFQTVPLNPHLWGLSLLIGATSLPLGAVLKLISSNATTQVKGV
ncbi:Calcium-transporting ATPase 2 [Choanephora cucurbitarum]|uniref:Calcium-transporting ATPase n=1 Tax=Choanephora cucurbitarum TaxID=101091 RepID=A0A1C7NQD9_9FUNG|nr:Calcium-transporting ATPase 2 [Choanephora cucurbitarum]